MRNQLWMAMVLLGTLMGTNHASAISNITAIVDGQAYQCGFPPPPAPEYKLYCTCKELFGRTSLNLMAFNPQTAEEKKIREVAQFTGSAVNPAMQHCRKALQDQTYAECQQ